MCNHKPVLPVKSEIISDVLSEIVREAAKRLNLPVVEIEAVTPTRYLRTDTFYRLGREVRVHLCAARGVTYAVHSDGYFSLSNLEGGSND